MYNRNHLAIMNLAIMNLAIMNLAIHELSYNFWYIPKVRRIYTGYYFLNYRDTVPISTRQ